MSTRRTTTTAQTVNLSVASKHQEPEDSLLTDLFTAYYCARANKRNTWAQVKFERRLTDNLIELYDDIRQLRYKVGRSICFIIRDPVQREIFAASFRDRVVHHLMYNDLSPIFEPEFIDDSYSCRVGKGTLYGIGRLERAMWECSEDYTREAWVLKLDISGYFMSINRQRLYECVNPSLAFFPNERRKILHYLLSQIIFNDPTQGCRIKGSRSDWKGLPHSKSLLWSPEGCGLPIGNLTSQLFSNIYLNGLDHYVLDGLGFPYYGRYVDDFYLVDRDKSRLLDAIGPIRDFLRDELLLTLHPRKVYLQPVARGVKFLGAFLKLGERYPIPRTMSKYHKSMANYLPFETDPYRAYAVTESYRGYFSHFDVSL